MTRRHSTPPSRDAHPLPCIQQLTVEDDPETVEVIFTQGELFDYTALDALNTLSKQCAAAAAAAVGRIACACRRGPRVISRPALRSRLRV